MPHQVCPYSCPCKLSCRIDQPDNDRAWWASLHWWRRALAYLAHPDPTWRLRKPGERTTH